MRRRGARRPRRENGSSGGGNREGELGGDCGLRRWVQPSVKVDVAVLFVVENPTPLRTVSITLPSMRQARRLSRGCSASAVT